MSVSIRISDDTAEELKSVQPDGMSLSKMCDTLLKLTLRKIKTDKENDDSTESFMEMVKFLTIFQRINFQTRQKMRKKLLNRMRITCLRKQGKISGKKLKI